MIEPDRRRRGGLVPDLRRPPSARYATYFADCTPGYLNNEFRDARGARHAVGLLHVRSAVDYNAMLSDWRAEGATTGVIKTPVR